MIRNVLQHYLDTTAGYFPQAVEDSLHKVRHRALVTFPPHVCAVQACMLLNNLHVLRQNLQDLYGVMGGEVSCFNSSTGSSRGRIILEKWPGVH